MAVLIDTTALFALVDEDDVHHGQARSTLAELAGTRTALVTHSYVLLETVALAQRRLSLAAVRRLDEFTPLIEIEWVGRDVHERALAALLAADRRGISLVDWTSFLLMRDRGIRRAFAFDGDFATQGFELIPAASAG